MLTQEQINTYRGEISINTSNGDPTRVFLGAIGIGLLSWLLVQGILQGLFATVYCWLNPNESFEACTAANGVGSATFFIFQLLSGACWAMGTVLLWVFSGAKFLYYDIRDAIAMRKEIDNQTEKIANDIASNAIANTPNMPKQVQTQPQPVTQVTNVDQALRLLNERLNRKAGIEATEKHLNVLYAKVKYLEDELGIEEPVEPTPPTLESMAEMITDLQAQIAEKEKPAKPAPKKTTRTRTTKKVE